MVRASLCACLLLLLSGCGWSSIFSLDKVDEPGLRSASSFNASEPAWDYKRPSNWEIADKDWNEMRSGAIHVYHRELTNHTGRKFFAVRGGGSDSGANVDVRISHIDRGHYTFFTYAPAVIDCELTITDAKSGKVLFNGRGRARTPGGGGWDKAGDGGRIEGAHIHLAKEIISLVEHFGPK